MNQFCSRRNGRIFSSLAGDIHSCHCLVMFIVRPLKSLIIKMMGREEERKRSVMKELRTIFKSLIIKITGREEEVS